MTESERLSQCKIATCCHVPDDSSLDSGATIGSSWSSTLSKTSTTNRRNA